jgi:phage shock protein PspC (stress-responsive transcriptional regulator)
MITRKQEGTQTKQTLNNTYFRLYRSEENRILGGVAGGIGEYFSLDPTIIRIIFVLLTIFGGYGILLYVVLWILIPTKSVLSSGRSSTLIRDNVEDMKRTAKTFSAKLQTEAGERNRIWWAILLLAVGTIFLLQNYGIYYFDFNKLWPFLLILVGLLLLRNR